MEITDKQKNVIHLIELNLNVHFKGTTKADATKFISKYIEESRREAFEDKCNSYSLPNQ